MALSQHWIHIELVPMWAHIKNLRHFVREFCVGMKLCSETADQVAMTTSELLENATKYASTLWVRYDLRINPGQAEVSVTNLATAQQRKMLLLFLGRVSRGDALENYLCCLERPPEDGVSQLGLARIRYEAGAELSASETCEEVCVTARIPLAPEQPQLEAGGTGHLSG